VGYLGNSATNVIFPLTVLCVAFGVLIGDASATYMNLKLGEGDPVAADQGVGNGITLSVMVSAVLFLMTVFFLKPIAYLFGCTKTVEPYALGYGSIVMIGFPFVIIATALNSMIRADGSPKLAMASLVAGAVFNTVADPVFIFVLKWGVRGAAIATIIGQFLSFVISISYMRRWRSVKLERKDYKLNGAVLKEMLPLGIASFINQMTTVVMTAFINNTLTRYGGASKYGTDIPLAVMGITLKVNQIFLFVVVGIATGAQPAISFNYGAKNYGRVLEALKICIKSALVASAIAFCVFQFAPMSIVRLFGAESDLYNEFAVMSLRIFLLLCIPDGVQTVASIFVQAVKKPGQAMVLSLSRQIVFLIPLVLILPKFMGITGVLWAGPIADGMAFVLASFVLAADVKEIKRKIR
jgi:putative MATE family efflux protein